MSTSLKKIMALSAIVGLVAMNAAYAATGGQIGTGSVVGTGAFDSTINWDGSFGPGSASGSVTGIIVSANVAPVLNFQIQSGSLNLGTLSSAYSTGTTGLEVGTNAVNGIVITATTANGGLRSTTASHTIGLSGNDALYGAEDYQFFADVGTSDSSSGASISGVTPTTMSGTTQQVTVYSANRPQNSDATADVTFGVRAKIAESTPAAADYADTITFSITGTF